jgi:ankyrin repeat protein
MSISASQPQLNLSYLQAAAHGQLEKVKKCLEKGADPEAVDSDGEVYYKTLREGHNIDLVNKEDVPKGSTALHLSCAFGFDRVTEFLSKEHNKLVFSVTKSNNDTPLCELMQSRFTRNLIERFELLVFSGANLNRMDERGWTYFHIMASEERKIPMLQTVLNYVSKSRVFLFQFLPSARICNLIIDYQCGFSLDLLKQKAINLLKRKTIEQTALDMAVAYGNPKAKELLEEVSKDFEE